MFGIYSDYGFHQQPLKKNRSANKVEGFGSGAFFSYEKNKLQITWDVFFSNHPPEFIDLPLIGHSYWKSYVCYVQLAVNSGIK